MRCRARHGCTVAIVVSAFAGMPASAQTSDPFQSAPVEAVMPKRAVAPRPHPQRPMPEAEPAVAPVSPPADPDLASWRTIAESGNAADFENYLQRFPQGRFGDRARERLAALRPPAVPSEATLGSLQVRIPSGVSTPIARHMSWDGGCMARLGFTIVIIEKPRSGNVELRDEPMEIPGHGRGARTHCEGRPIVGKRLYYRPNPAFIGTDRLVYDMTLRAGMPPIRRTIEITVR